jgi:predicted Rossmann-fold nucleotide-binding protein
MQKYKIGVFGSAVNESEKTIETAKKLGQILGEKDVVVITGACAGMPDIVAREAAKKGTEVWGFAPVGTNEELKALYAESDFSVYKKIYYIPKNFRDLFFIEGNTEFKVQKPSLQKYRNVISTANCDGAIVLSGRWGSMNEFTNLFDMGKVIGVLTGTGGIADELPELMRKINKPSGAKVFFDNDPEKLVENVLEELEKRN